MPNRFARHTVLPQLGEEGQRRLGEATALVMGCGALGSHTAENLLRAGVGHLLVVDRDLVEETNLHRVSLFTADDLGRPKADAAADRLGQIAPEGSVTSHVAHLGPELAEGLVPKVDVVLDGLDNLESRYVANDACVKYGVPWVYTAVLATHGLMMPVVPGMGPCLRCLFPCPPPVGAIPTCAEAGILGPVPAALAALQSTVAIQILTRSPDLVPGRLVHLDLWTGRTEIALVERADSCVCCGQRRFEFLDHPSRHAALCGDAVQIVPRVQARLDLAGLAARLAPLGEARIAHGVLVAKLEGVSLTVYADGRVVVKGEPDPQRAQDLYDRYVAR